MKNAEHRAIAAKLKGILKQKGMKYADLASSADMSISTLKKIFAGHDCSFSKIVQICNALEVNFLDVASSIQQEKSTTSFNLTIEQERFFSKNLEFYLFFHFLFRENLSIQEAKEKLKFNDAKLWKVLNKLEEFKLIEVGINMNAKLLVSGSLIFLHDGPMADIIINTVTMKFSEYLLIDIEDDGDITKQFMRLQFGKLTPHNYKQMIKDLTELHENYRKSNFSFLKPKYKGKI